MILEKLYERIYLIRFPDQIDMTSTLLRIQEHYESPYFAGKVFDLSEFEEWYKKSKDTDVFTYYTDWTGYNFPSYVLKPFYNNEFKNISDKERAILNLFSDVKGDFYVIGVIGDDSVTLRHEIAHALYYVYQKYKSAVDKLCDAMKEDTPLFYEGYLIKLIETGYAEAVFKDEINAFMVSDEDFFDNCSCYCSKMSCLFDAMLENYIKSTKC